MVWISIHAHRFRDEGKKEKRKKWSSSRNLRLRHSVHPCICPRTKVYLRLGGNKQIFRGGKETEKHFSGTGPVHTFLLRGHKQ